MLPLIGEKRQNSEILTNDSIMLVNLIVRMTTNLRLHEVTNKIEISRVIVLLCLKSESKDPRSSNIC